MNGSPLRGGSSTDLSEQPCGAGPAPDAQPAPAAHLPPYLVLLRVGFTLPPALPPERCALTAPFHPYPGAGTCPPDESGKRFQGRPPEEG